MKPRFSKTLMEDLARSVQASVARTGLVNIPELAEQIRLRNSADNVALEDIAEQVMAQAQVARAPMEFDSAPMRKTGLSGNGADRDFSPA